MKPKWIIEDFSRDQSTTDLIEEVKRQGFECQHVGIVDYFDFNKSISNPGDCVVFIGSIQLANLARENLKECHPVVWTNWENFACSVYYPHYQKFLFNNKYQFFYFENLLARKFDIYYEFGREATVFIRPDSGEKEFTGELVHLEELEKWVERRRKNGVKPDLLCVVSTPKKINGEWRFVIDSFKREIITKSTYQYQGERCQVPGAPQGVIDFANRILTEVDWQPSCVYCLDICEDGDGTPWLLELTSFNSAGLYACDKAAIVKRVSEIAEGQHEVQISLLKMKKEWALTPEELKNIEG